MRLLITPPKLFSDAPDWEVTSEGIWWCVYKGIEVVLVDRFDDEPPGWSVQWGTNEDDDPELENENVDSAQEAVEWLRNQFDPNKREKPKVYAPKIILYGFDLDKWVKRWNISLREPIPCPNCGTLRTPTIPYRQGNLRGVLSEYCSCGYNSHAPYIFVTTHGGLPQPSDL